MTFMRQADDTPVMDPSSLYHSVVIALS